MKKLIIRVALASPILALAGSGLPAASASTGAAYPVMAASHSHRLPPAAAKVGHVKAAKIGAPQIMGPRPRGNFAPTNLPDPGNMNYNGGPVQHTPLVYIDFWGNWWKSTGNTGGNGGDVEQALWSYFHAVGQSDDPWATIMSQYRNGSGNPSFGSGVWGDWVVDTSNDPSQSPTDAQLADEAASIANWWGVAGNPDVQIVVVSPSGDNPGGGFGSHYCAWHDQATDTSADFIPFINLPYIPDQGSTCGAAVTGSYLDGLSIVAGHEFAETVTDPGAEYSSGTLGAWYDNSSATNFDQEEIGDKCAWYNLVGETLSYVDSGGISQTGMFPQQPLWDNSTSRCRPDMLVVKPGNQSSRLGSSVSLQIQSRSSTGPLSFSATGLPRGLTINSFRGLISGLANWPGNYGVKVTASNSPYNVSTGFTWRVLPPNGPIKAYYHTGHCVNDSSGSLANGTKVTLYSCNSTLGQDWAPFPDHTLRRYGGSSNIDTGKCLNISSTGTANGTKVNLYACNGSNGQKWVYRSATHDWYNSPSGKCLMDPGENLTGGTQLVLYACNGAHSEAWTNA